MEGEKNLDLSLRLLNMVLSVKKMSPKCPWATHFLIFN